MIAILVILLPVVAFVAYNSGKNMAPLPLIPGDGQAVTIPNPVAPAPKLGEDPTPPPEVACGVDLKFCENGTPVGRVAPTCDFAPCP